VACRVIVGWKADGRTVLGWKAGWRVVAFRAHRWLESWWWDAVRLESWVACRATVRLESCVVGRCSAGKLGGVSWFSRSSLAGKLVVGRCSAGKLGGVSCYRSAGKLCGRTLLG
jgi:hypothetical protein